MTAGGITIDRNLNGSYTAWWSDSSGHLCHMQFYFCTKREIRRTVRELVRNAA